MNCDTTSIRHEWYQTPSHVVISLLLKNVNPSYFEAVINSNSVEIIQKSQNNNDKEICSEFNLSNNVIPAESFYKVLSTKVEFKLKKQSEGHWLQLEEIKDDKHNSSKNWDKIAKDIEKDADEEGDPLNNLFQKIYNDGSDETRKAMIKSFTESSGTVLSTNWKDIKEKQVDVKPPDGMEFKKYDC